MADEGKKLTPAEAVTAFTDGAYNKETISLTFETMDGGRHTFGFRQSDIPALITQLVQLTQRGAQLAGRLRRPALGERMNASAVDAVALGVIPGRQEGEAYLAVHTGAFPLAFAVKSDDFKALFDEVEDIGILKVKQ